MERAFRVAKDLLEVLAMFSTVDRDRQQRAALGCCSSVDGNTEASRLVVLVVDT